MTETKQDSDRLRRFFRKIIIAFALLGVTMAATVGYVYKTTQDNKEALCAYRGDLETRIASGEQFLKENPNGIAGISPTLLKTNLANQKRVVQAFSGVNCSGSAAPTPTPAAKKGEKDT